MRCAHCWFHEGWKKENLGGDVLTFDEIERTARSIRHITFLSLTGGEAFGREDLVEIAEMLSRNTRLRRYQIPTSGYRTDIVVQKTEELLKRMPRIPFRVDVSLDGDEELHDRIRGVPGAFSRLRETIVALRGLRRRYPHFDIGVITTISSFNHDRVETVERVARDLNPEGEWMVNIVRGAPRDSRALDCGTEGYERAQRLIEDRVRSAPGVGHAGHATAGWLSAKNAVRRRIILRVLEGRERGGGCAAGSVGGVIYSDGDVRACELLDRSLGNLRDVDYDLRALWSSAEADAVRDWIQDTECICTQECFLSTSMLIQPRHWPAVVRERMRLAVSRRSGRERHAPESSALSAGSRGRATGG